MREALAAGWTHASLAGADFAPLGEVLERPHDGPVARAVPDHRRADLGWAGWDVGAAAPGGLSPRTLHPLLTHSPLNPPVGAACR